MRTHSSSYAVAAAVTVVVGLTSLPVLAQDRAERRRERAEERANGERRGVRDPRVNERQAHQAHRMVRGVKNGSLTPAETASLSAQEKSFAAEESAFKSDGHLSTTEREALRQQLDVMSKNIYDDKHNADGVQLAPRLGPEATRAEAHEAAANAQRLAQLRQRLNGATLGVDERARLEVEHDQLVDVLFEARE